MTDRIVLRKMVFQGRHGVLEIERTQQQPFEVDVEIHLDTRPAGLADDLTRTVDYREVFDIAAAVIEGPSRLLIETLAEEIAGKVLEATAPAGAQEVVIRVAKPRVALPGILESAAVEITRRRAP
jgi:dihydroneopterin aldolase